MSRLSNPHDAFFKEIFSRQDVARSFLENYLPPEITLRLDLSELTISSGSFVDEHLRAHHSDILYKVALQGSGEEGYVYLLFEHKSYPDRQTAFQVLRYMMRIWAKQLQQKQALRPIFPVVVYHGKTKWQASADFAALIEDLPDEMRPYLPDFRYHLCDLSRYTDEEIVGSVYLQIALLLLKYALRGDFWEKLPGVLRLLADLQQINRQSALAYFERILRYVTYTRKDKDKDVKKAITEALFDGGEAMEDFVDQWKRELFEEGWAQGIQQGIQQGLQQGQMSSLLNSIELGLELKFGVDGLRILPEIRKIKDADVLRAVQEGLKVVNTPIELQRIYKDLPDAPSLPRIHEGSAPYTV